MADCIEGGPHIEPDDFIIDVSYIHRGTVLWIIVQDWLSFYKSMLVCHGKIMHQENTTKY